jgi:SAM-dependent methyltransferase
MTRNEPKQNLATPAHTIASDAFGPADDLWEDLLVCPTCAGRLKEACDKLFCALCRKEWPVVDGVPTFVDYFPHQCEISRELLLKVNTLIRTNHWKAVMLESEDSAIRKAAAMVSNGHCANWHWLTSLGPQARVLDVCAGLGAQSHALARRFREVFALEPGREQVDFLRQRFGQDGIRNVKVLRASPWDIPLPPGSFDAVVLNGTLPWVATGREGDPRALQVAALNRVFQLLAPGGYLYMGIENRMFWRSFVGAPDARCGLPYVTVLPRRLANWFAKRAGQAEGYRNYTYSARGYKRLLAAAGFTNVQLYLAMPGYEASRMYLPLKENVFSYYHKNFEPLRSGALATVASRVLSGLGLLKYVQNSFVILARKES